MSKKKRKTSKTTNLLKVNGAITDQIIDDLIEKTKLQQEALMKIMISINKNVAD